MDSIMKTNNNLCCVLNPEFKCKYCKAAICLACNKAEYKKYRDTDVDINTIGHLLDTCVKKDDAGHGWKEVWRDNSA